MLVGVTHESPEVVEAWRRKHRPKLPLVVLGKADFEAFLGVTQFPTRAVIGPDGTLRFRGGGTPWSAVESALEESEPGPWIPKAFAKAERTLGRNDFPRAYDELMRVLEGSAEGAPGKPGDSALSAPDRSAGERLQTTLERWAAAELRAAHALRDARDPYGAWTRTKPIAKARTWFPVTRDARKLMENLEALASFEGEREAHGLLAEADRLAADPATRSQAEELLERLSVRYPDTAAARVLAERR